MQLPCFEDIVDAHKRIKPYINQTPVVSATAINRMFDVNIYFKCENQQKVKAFKFRGATNAVLKLTEKEALNGVATHSSGNHAAALALAAKSRNIPAYIVMPSSSPQIKIKNVEECGGIITFCAPTLQAREQVLQKVVSDTNSTFIHPYDNFNVICGQGTACLEMIEEVRHLDIVMAPVGGGGLLSGTSIAAKHFFHDIQVIGAEPANADDAYRSFKAGKL
ncbi:MAG: pyridoxal-phosphate dependent enzyme, partial [Lactococcus lactis]|nr:pyridoxal-phosphate dependent enzyme [Lactococcus lactis]